MSLSKREKIRLKTKYGEWAVVTGASSGIGEALAKNLAEAGLNIVLVARRELVLEQVALQLRNEYKIQTKVIAVDLSDQMGVQKVLDQTKNLNVGLMVAGAGFGTSGAFVKADLAKELNMIQVNCSALLTMTLHFTKVFAARNRGGIILLSSMVGFQGVPYAAHYAATKAYVQSLGEALYVELHPLGVDVLAAAPGPVSSDFAKRANMKLGRALRPQDVAAPILRSLGKKGTVLPGFLTKLLVGSLRTVPRWGKVRIMKLVMGGMTKHQSK